MNSCLNCGYTGGVWRIGLCNDCFDLKEDGVPMAVSQHSPHPEENEYFWATHLPTAEDFQLHFRLYLCIIKRIRNQGGDNENHTTS